MIGCTDPKYKCGQTNTSSCIFYSGKTLTSIDEDKQPECDASLDDVIFALDAQLKIIKDGYDLTGLNLDCLTLATDVVTPFAVHQAEILQICENKANIAALTTQFNDWDITSEIVTITLPECLTEDAAPCAVGTNQYSLVSLLLLFANMLCDHETRITNLE